MSAQQPPLQVEETERLAALRALGVQRTDARFDDIAALAGSMFGVPVALVTLIEEQRLLFVGRWGATTAEAPRRPALCPYMINAREPLVLLDARADERFERHAGVISANIRFYAAASLVVDGQCVGALCILDFKPRAGFSGGELEALQRLAAMAVRQLEAQSLRAQLSVACRERMAAQKWAALALEEAASAFAACDRLAANLGGRFHDALARVHAALAPGAAAEESAALLDMADELAAVARLETPSGGASLYQPSEVLAEISADWTDAVEDVGVAVEVRDAAQGMEMLGDPLRFEELVENLLVDLTPRVCGTHLHIELGVERRSDRPFFVLRLRADVAYPEAALGWRLSARNRVLIGGMAGHWEISANERRIVVALPARLCSAAQRPPAASSGDNVVQFEGFRDARRYELR